MVPGRKRAVHIELDAGRDLIVTGREDLQSVSDRQADQYALSVGACCALARSFADAGYDVAIDDVLEPLPTRSLWMPGLDGLDVRLVVLHPSLEVVLARGGARHKRVNEQHVRAQHESLAGWPQEFRVDSTHQTTEHTLIEASRILERESLKSTLSRDGV